MLMGKLLEKKKLSLRRIDVLLCYLGVGTSPNVGARPYAIRTIIPLILKRDLRHTGM